MSPFACTPTCLFNGGLLGPTMRNQQYSGMTVRQDIPSELLAADWLCSVEGAALSSKLNRSISSGDLTAVAATGATAAGAGA